MGLSEASNRAAEQRIEEQWRLMPGSKSGSRLSKAPSRPDQESIEAFRSGSSKEKVLCYVSGVMFKTCSYGA